MTTTEYRDQLIQQYNEAVTNLQQLKGAILACEQILQSQETEEETVPTDEESTDD